MHIAIVLIGTFLLHTLTPGLAAAATPEDRADRVEQFLAAFNRHDPEAMAALVTEDIKWGYVSQTGMSFELEGKAALVKSMGEYFASCPSCRSENYGMLCSTARVSVIEVASWKTQNGPKSQASLAIYEFSGDLIQAVYYFPEEPTPRDRQRKRSC